ncbi:MAG: glutamate racemase [Nitrososphaerales archaeon]
MPDKRPIGVFDSGMGSLSLIQALRQELPNESIVYLADRVHYPYGKKSREQLRSIIIQTIRFLEKFDLKAIVAASITPSMLVLKEARLYTNIPVFGVYPTISDAVGLSKTKQIALLATEGTINSDELHEYVKPYITTARIVMVNASPIIDLVESGKFLESATEAKESMVNAMQSIKTNPKIDVAILASTHLVLIKDLLANLFPKVQLINPALNTVNQVKTYLQYQNITNQGKGTMKILVSKGKVQFERVVKALGIKESIEEVLLDFKIEPF